MARKKSPTLTEVEQQIMEVLWDAGSGTVAEVTEALTKYKKVAFNTVQTVLRILEDKRYVRHRAEGRAFRYVAVVDRDTASTSAVNYLLRRFFDGAPGKLAMNLIENERLTPAELNALNELIAKAKA
ncbi:MAG: BlaI/MecI/CopY family transcriptional regulator [Candidatus Eremiobacteraeota bacterium]|nr:BlaI/MecI/CopY family transcriptional regulator [Candidatus Eremiobacteraeota bacterium]